MPRPQTSWYDYEPSDQQLAEYREANGMNDTEGEQMFTLRFYTDNDQFHHDVPHIAMADILRKVAGKLDNGQTGGTIVDDNGNTIGKFSEEQD